MPVLSHFACVIDNHSGRELFAFHWHPDGRSPVAVPHLHVSAALRGTTPSGEAAILPLDKVHVPTGCVLLAGVVRLLVAELGVAPVVGDWGEQLARGARMVPAFPS